MASSILVCCLFVLCLFWGAVGTANADLVPAIDYGPGGVPGGFGGGVISAGYSFSTGGSPVTYNALGLAVAGPAYSDPVRVYKDGTATNVASATILTSDPISSATINGRTYQYHTVTPFTLAANTTYDIVVDFVNSGADTYAAQLVALDPNLTIGSARSGSLGSFPTDDSFEGLGPYIGATLGNVPAVVPEPSSLVLASLAAAGLGLTTWCRRKKATT